MRRSSGRIIAATALAACLVVSLAMVPASTAAAASDGASAKTIYSLSNTERSKRDLPKLVRNSSLDRVAKAWAKKMASTANGKCTIGSKGLRHNPSLKSQLPKGWKKVGENVGCGYTTSGASGMLNAWMQSSGHRANILAKHFTDIGVGYYTDAQGMTWGVQVFAQYTRAKPKAKAPKASSTPKAKPKAAAPSAPSAPKADSKAEPKAVAATTPAPAQGLAAIREASAALLELGVQLAQERITTLIAALSELRTVQLLQPLQQPITQERAGAAAPEALRAQPHPRPHQLPG